MESTHFWYSVYKNKGGWNWVIVAVFENDEGSSIERISGGWCPLRFMADLFGRKGMDKVYKNIIKLKIEIEE